MQSKRGMVYLVGAGPGDPGMLTLRGAELLRSADVVLYDGLVNPTILAHASSPSICYSVGKHGRSRIWSQQEINERLVAEASAGKRVVRLKGGDPVVFGRLAEECDVLRAAGIPFEIVPGITAALAAGGFAGIPITHRGFASAVALVTGHEEDEKQSSSIDWPALAKFPGTLVIYMGVTTVHVWTQQLLQAGMSPETPAAIIRRCSWPDQEVVTCRLNEVSAQLTPASRMRPPVIVVLGPVVDLHETMSWFAARPLFGQTVLVTRAEQQADGVCDQLTDLGASVLLQPAIQIGPVEDATPLHQAVAELDQYDWVVFSSRNGVEHFLRAIAVAGFDVRRFGNCKLACVGQATETALAEYSLKADLVPATYRAEGLIVELAPRVSGKRVLLIRASRGRELLSQELRTAGGLVTEVVAYSHEDVSSPDPEVVAALDAGRIDWVTVTSSAIARSLVNLFGVDRLRRTKLASISSLTSDALREHGLEPAAEAMEATMDGLVAAIALAHPRVPRA